MAVIGNVRDFIRISDFADIATVAGLPVPVLFDAAYADPFGIAGTEPRATCASVDVAVLVQGSPLTILGQAYTVRDKQPDGTGITTLLLEAA